ncbi:MAG: ABC transporter permease [Candidatus Aminicenantes bacterium]|jgi:ABC-2 type transport system permease protein
MFTVVRHIIRKEFIQTFRDKRMFLPLFAAPVIQLILFGFAATTDVKNVPLGVLDYDKSQESRALVTNFLHADAFHLDFHLSSNAEIDELIQTGKIKVAVVIPSNFEQKLHRGQRTAVQIILDGSDANSATIVLSYIARLLSRHSERIVAEYLGQGSAGLLSTQERIWYNPDLKSSIYMVPGVICLVLLLTTLLLTAMAVTKEREMGTLESLVVSPIKSWELIFGKTTPFVVIGLVDIVLIILAGKAVFGLPIRGSFFFLLGVSFLFILTSLSIGLFISTVSRTQQQAIAAALFFLMPAMLLSGIFTPIESMPKAIQYLSLLNPLRFFGKSVRGILLKGNGLSILWPEVLALFLFGLVALVFSTLRFRKYLE